MAEAIARGIGGLTALFLAFSGRLQLSLKLSQLFKIDLSLFKQLMEIGAPAAGEQFIFQSSQLLYTVFVASMGTAAIAANQIVMTVNSFSFLLGLGFGIAATALVGQSLGAGNQELAESYGWISNRIGTVFMSAVGLVFLVFAKPLGGLFTSNAEVGQMAAACIKIIGFSQIPTAAMVIFSGALKGAGDTKFIMYSTAAGQWGVRLVLTYYFAFVLHLGLTGVWLGMFGDTLFRGLVNTWRFWKGTWKEIFKIEHSAESTTL